MFQPFPSTWRCAAARVFFATVLMFSLAGCDLGDRLSRLFFLVLNEFANGSRAKDQIISSEGVAFTLSSDEAARGTTTVVTVSSPTFTLTEGGGVSFVGEGITARPRGSASTDGVREFDLEIAADAPLQPFRVVVIATPRVEITPTQEIVVERRSERPFFIRAGSANVPRLTAVVPAEAFRGAPATLEFTGTNFDASLVVVPEDPGIAVLDPVVTSSTTATAEVPFLPANTRIGDLLFAVETTAGRSQQLPIFVQAPQAAPALSGIFPNYVPAGVPTNIAFAGARFFSGAQVIATAGLLAGTSNVTSRFRALQRLRAAGLPRTESLAIESLGGLSNPQDLHIVPASFSGPRIRRITPASLTPGAVNQVEIEWENLRNDATPALLAPANEFSNALLLTSTVLPAREQPPGPRSIAILEVAPVFGDAQCDLGARVAGTPAYTTNLVGLLIATQRPMTPLVQRTQIGRVSRGGEVEETVVGERLAGAFAIEFSPPTIQAVIVGTPSATSLRMRVTASAQAPLTGDARTVFTVKTRESSQGVDVLRTSNEASYLVEPGGGTGPVPRVDGLFPNFVYPDNAARTFFDVTGANLQNPWELLVTPAGATRAEYDLAANSPRGNALLISLGVNTPATTNSLGLTVTTETGTLVSNTVPIAVLDPAHRTGPEILSVAPSTQDVAPDSVFQFLISGNNFGPAGPGALVRFARRNDDPIRSVRLFAPTAPGSAPGSVVVQLDIGPALDGAFTEFALEVNGLVTRLIGISYAAPPEDEPFVSRTTFGEIRRGLSVRETIRGSGLLNVTDIVFEQPGITVSNIEQSTDGGASFRATFSATVTATLTGDALTTFRVVTDGDVQSNSAGYIVLP